MLPLVKLKEDLRFSKEIQDMIEVLKAATATQFRSLQQRRQGFETYKDLLDDFLTELEPLHASHPFLRERALLPKVVVMITSDEGFLGGLNELVINAGLEQMGGRDEAIVIGERGARYLTENQTAAFTVLPGIGDEITYQRAVAVREALVAKYLDGSVGAILCAYPQFLSLTTQRVEVTRLLPSGNIFGQKWARAKAKTSAPSRPLPMEPGPGAVVDFLVRTWLMQRLYDIFWESKLAECAARLIHLEGSHEEITEHSRKLFYQFFKNVHEKSDKSIREIFASRLQWENAAEKEREGMEGLS